MTTAQEKPAKTRKNKTAFVKSLPEDMPAKEVVDRAKKLGITISDKYVYVVRSNARKNTRKRRGPGRPPGSTASVSASPSEREFKRLALNLGVKKAEQLMANLKKSAAEIVAGK